ncbi:MAG: 50S ribosomal protein L25 [Candidatus Cryptobacteroides sp.]|jgi:ribosomal protein L25, Ctc-form
MKHFELKGQIRETGNQAVIKALRRQGLVPCNLYGQGIKNVLFTVSEKDLKGLTHNPSSYIVDLVLSDGNKYQAILHELQFHPVKDNCLHVDFLSVSDDKPIAIEVPIAITGHAAGVQAGGKFFQLKRKLRVSALMKDLPDEIKIDISKLKIGERIVAGDIHLDNVAILTFKGTILCTVKSTRQAAPGSVEEGETSAESGAEESAE